VHRITIDLDPADDPTHGQQEFSWWRHELARRARRWPEKVDRSGGAADESACSLRAQGRSARVPSLTTFLVCASIPFVLPCSGFDLVPHVTRTGAMRRRKGGCNEVEIIE
jgi:hypothetical protein